MLLHNGEAKIADLGFAKMLEEEGGVTKTNLGTPTSMAPEITEQQPYGLKVDVWSLGIVYYQMIFGRLPYTGHDEYSIYLASLNPPSFAGVNISDTSKDFITRCLTANPDKRISWSEIYQHRLIKDE